jgi:hypothetical protein
MLPFTPRSSEWPLFFKRFIAHKYIWHVQGQVTKLFPKPIWINIKHYDTSETDVNINISANNGSGKLKKNTTISGKLIIARLCLYFLYMFVKSARVRYNSLFVGLGGWHVSGSEQKM